MAEICLFGVVIGILGFMTYEGYRKGFIRILLSVEMTIVAFILTMALSKPCENYIRNNTSLYNKISVQMQEYIEKCIPEEADLMGQKQQDETVKQLQLPKTIQDKLISKNTLDNKLKLGVDSFSEYLAKSLTDLLIRSISMIVLFLAIKVILSIILLLLNVVSKLPVINGINKSLGAVFGFGEGILIIWIGCILLTAAGGTEVGQVALKAICNNKILSYIFNKNIFLGLMNKVM